jgi:hypothetical protein
MKAAAARRERFVSAAILEIVSEAESGHEPKWEM